MDVEAGKPVRELVQLQERDEEAVVMKVEKRRAREELIRGQNQHALEMG